MRSRLETRTNELTRLAGAKTEAAERAATAERDFTALETQVAGLDAGEEGLDAEHENARKTLDELEQRLERLREEEQTAERERAALAARKEALELGLDHKDGAAALLAADDQVSGLLGSVAALLGVEPGFESAVSAALGRAADAVAVESVEHATEALNRLAADELGRAGLLLAAESSSAADQSRMGTGAAEPDDWPSLPDGATYAFNVIAAPAHLRPALARMLYKVAVVESIAHARALVTDKPDLVAVTWAGDLLGAHFAYGGSTTSQSLIEVQAAVDDATSRLTEATHHAERLRFERSSVDEQRASAAEWVESTLGRLHESDAQLAAVAERLGDLGSAARSAREEEERLDTAIAEAKQAAERDTEGLRQLEERLAAARETPDEEPSTTDRDRFAEEAKNARQRETDARLTLRTGEERARATAGRAESLEKAARTERSARARARAKREQRLREGRVAEAVLSAVEQILDRVEVSLRVAGVERAEAERVRAAREEEVAAVRERVRQQAAELEQLTNSVHRDEMARAEQRMRVEQLEQRAVDELGVDPQTLMAEYGPDQLVPSPPPVPGSEDAPQPDPRPFERAEQEKRLKQAERQLSQLGKVNPLALEEYAALEERNKFLTEQLEDVKKTRKDLLDIIREVDDRVEQVFTEAYRDTEREFEHAFARLFPGGEGKLVLTDPSDMLTTGIDVEARPPGKKVKRLSLLSGGERSLVAVAFLVALFKARPSPFYVLDEVEAALDDTNLGRLLELYEELREQSQLLVITHQKRTMEIADALYGVSMRGDGVSAVISQRIRDAEPA